MLLPLTSQSLDIPSTFPSTCLPWTYPLFNLSSLGFPTLQRSQRRLLNLSTCPLCNRSVTNLSLRESLCNSSALALFNSSTVQRLYRCLSVFPFSAFTFSTGLRLTSQLFNTCTKWFQLFHPTLFSKFVNCSPLILQLSIFSAPTTFVYSRSSGAVSK